MQTFRFHAHIWTPADGHCDKRYLIKGEDILTAQQSLLRRLAERDPSIKVNLKAVEIVK